MDGDFSSDEEREAFSMTDADMAREADPLGRKRRRRTKEEALYGVFYDGDEDGGDETVHRGERTKPSYTKPMSFIAAKDGRRAKREGAETPRTGGHPATSADDTGAAPETGNDSSGSEDEVDGEEVLRRALGHPAPAVRRETRPAVAAQDPSTGQPVTTRAPPPPPGLQRSAHPTVDPFRQGAAGKVLAEEAAGGPAAPTPTEVARVAKDPTATVGAYSTFRGETQRPDRDFAKFEKHTKGIGMKLLQRMGWKTGDGLGKGKQGITRPIDVKVRRRNEGLQERGERTTQSRDDFKQQDPEAKAEEAFHEQLQAWRAPDARHRKRKPRLNYRTAEEVEAERGAGDDAAEVGDIDAATLTAMKIVDLTGPEARVIDAREGHQGASARAAARQSVYRHRDGSVPMPELQYNANLLLDQAENDLQRSKGELVRDEKRLCALQQELAEMTLKLKHEDGHIARLTRIMAMVDQCEHAHDLGLEQCVGIFAQVHEAYPQEYAMYGLATLATAALVPLVRSALQQWNPLKAPRAHLDTFAMCRPLLQVRDGSMHFEQGASEELTGYDKLVWHALLPSFRTVLQDEWEPRKEPRAVVELLELWSPLLPTSILAHVMDQVVLPRLAQALEAWDPRTDPVPIHRWLHPWLPLAGDRLQALYAKLRFKLAACLRAWEPSDSSALAMLAPWRGVFDPRDMATFLRRTVVPKLGQALEDLVVTPADQRLDVWQAITAWHVLLPSADMAELLVGGFFPKMTQALCAWLSQRNANLAEVVDWYLAWKARLPSGVERDPRVRRQLQCALQLMDRAVQGEVTDVAALAARYDMLDVASTARGMRAPAAVATTTAPSTGPSVEARVASEAPVSVRDLVQRMAHAQGIIFAPRPGRTTASGLPLFQCGQLSVYFEGGVVFGRRYKAAAGDYRPISVDDLPLLAAGATS